MKVADMEDWVREDVPESVECPEAWSEKRRLEAKLMFPRGVIQWNVRFDPE